MLSTNAEYNVVYRVEGESRFLDDRLGKLALL